ncbi:MAG: hypothetical protein KA101_03020 [Saprospiraceae bacterium]|nr:hypothetical protein [Saprospiraceae bacterium]
MISNTRFTLLFCFNLIIFTSLFAQRIDSFPTEREAFMKQLEVFMTASKSENLEKVYKTFAKQIKNNEFLDDEVSNIQSFMNLMLKQKLSASPYFQNYLQTLQIIKSGEPEAAGKRFKELQTICTNLVSTIENRKLKPIDDYLKFAQSFYEKNALRESSLGVDWIASNNNYSIKTENKLPIIHYDKVNLYGIRKGDTITIYNTSGDYNLFEQVWNGNGGESNWSRVKIDEAKCEFGTYTLDTKKTLYEVPNAKLTYPTLFPNGSVEGHFQDKIVVENDATEGSYPRFESKADVLTIENIGGGAKYVGGFKLQGANVIGVSSKENICKLTIFGENNKPIYYGEADVFIIKRNEKITGESVRSTIYFGQDTLYHPSVNLRYEVQPKELSLQRGKRAKDRNPFFNSFWNMNVDADKIDWYIAKDSLLIGERSLAIAKPKDEAIFESTKFYKDEDYLRIQNIGSFNPISSIKVLAEQEKTNTLDALKVAKKLDLNFTIANIQTLLFDLTSEGFVDYDPDKQIVTVKEKIFHYAKASAKQTDFDNIRILSKTKDSNAIFSLANKKTLLNGVTRVEYSSKQKVALVPLNSQVMLRENKNMDFDGKLFAGFCTLQGKDFHFNYDKYEITLDSCRYFELFLPTGNEDKDGNKEAKSIASRIEHVNGILLIDAPNNKSGKENLPIFPSLNSQKNSFVYYDRKETFNSIYNRDSFYFELDKFNFNSLDSFAKEDIKFKGKLISAKIFPEFKETLLLREEDYSLGFVHQTPAEGYPNYSGKGKYKGEVDLSNKGMLGKGTVSYLTADVQSEDIIFRPNQMTCSAKQFFLAEDNGAVKVPQAQGIDVIINWLPYQDSMYVQSKEAPFELFKAGLHTVKGTLILTPNGLKARGLLDWDKGSITSNIMSFGVFQSYSDSLDLIIRALDGKNLAFDTKNLRGIADFEKQLGKFKGNTDSVVTTMPYNQYQTTMNDFDWDMKAQTVLFNANPNQRDFFTSIHPDQDSLIFEGKTGFYDLKTSLLKVGGVPYVLTCDAFVYPDSNKLEIQPGGLITTLTNAKIICDEVNKYHTINRATVDIKGRRLYTAKGFYEYNIGDKQQEIEFGDIIGQPVGKGARDEKKTVTRANGIIDESKNFYMDHKIKFKGEIGLNAESRNLTFTGFSILDADKLPSQQWFAIGCATDRNNVAIEYDKPKNPDGEMLFTGIYLSKEYASVYPRILQSPFFRKDRPIIDCTKGVLSYHKTDDRFSFGDSTKVLDNKMRGNRLRFNNKDASILAEGKMNLCSGLKYVSIKAAGRLKTVYDRNIEPVDQTDSTATSEPVEINFPTVSGEVMAGVNLLLPDALLSVFMNDIASATFDARDVIYSLDYDFYERTVAEFLPNDQEYNETVAGMKNTTLAFPKKQNTFDILFANVPMIWNTEYQSFLSVKDEVGIASVGGQPINKMLKCYVEFKMPSNEDDRLYIWVQAPSSNFYFFGYQKGILSTVSNNPQYMDALLKLKKKDKQRKMDDGEMFEIQDVTEATAQMFTSRVNSGRSK